MTNTLIFLLAILLTACGAPETVNVSAPTEAEGGERAEAREKEPELEAEDEPAGDAGKPKEPARRTVKARYELINDNPANDLFVSQNYCAGSSLRDCWLRSGLLTAYEDGSYEVSLEFWDTYDAEPYDVQSETVDASQAFLLTDKAKLTDDRAVGYKMLWAVVVPEDRTVTIVYDWSGDGPGLQGDDRLDTLEFLPVTD